MTLKQLLQAMHWDDLYGIVLVTVTFYGFRVDSWTLSCMAMVMLLFTNRISLRRIEEQLSDTRRIEKQVRDLEEVLREKTCEHLFTIRADGETRCQNCEIEL